MKKKIVLCILSLALIWGLSVHAEEASSYAQLSTFIDNDEANAQFFRNASLGHWDYYTNSAHYRGDSRVANSTVGNLYLWGYRSQSASTISNNPRIYAYLNDVQFTCPRALYVYYAYNGGSQVEYLRQRINQNTAPAGWGYVGLASSARGKAISHVTVTPDQSSSGRMGADGIRIDIN